METAAAFAIVYWHRRHGKKKKNNGCFDQNDAVLIPKVAQYVTKGLYYYK